MKWYIEFPLIYLICFCIFFVFFTNRADPLNMRIFIGLSISLVVSSVGYIAYREGMGKPVKEPYHDKKLTSKQWLLLSLAIIIMVFVIMFLIFILVW